MPSREHPHFFLESSGSPEPFTPKGGGGGEADGYPEIDRREHGRALRDQLADSLRASRLLSQEAERLTGITKTGAHLTFESFEGTPLKLESLENRRFNVPPELVAYRRVPGETGTKEIATVWMPPGTESSLDRKLKEFSSEPTEKERPKHQPLVQAMARIGLAHLESVWTEPTRPFPARDEVRWWEVWLARRSGDEVQLLEASMELIEAEVAPGRLEFPDRTVVKVKTSAERLSRVVLHLDGLAELRAVSASAEFFHALPASVQSEWIEDLLHRAQYLNDDNTPAACILDTGVRGQHPLIAPAVLPNGLHAYHPSWGVADDNGHGTEMAGIALYQNVLADVLAGTEPLGIPIGIESVKILPPPPRRNPKALWGTITASAVALVETAAPERRRAFTMAITASEPTRQSSTRDGDREEAFGIPTSWSASVDATAAGQAIDVSESGVTAISTRNPEAARLFIVSAGNVRPPWEADYKNRCALEALEDPAQAWNAITVGAFTNLTDPSPHQDCTPLAEAGDLSPHSRTSQLFDREWPLKPDVVFEGGNLAVRPTGEVIDPEGMMLLTSDGKSGRWSPRNLVVTSGTSPAAAMAGGVAARIWAEYPNLWPETVRGLISHSARWTRPMEEALDACRTLSDQEPLVRTFGMGVPSLQRALRSAADEVTLVAEEVIRPFEDGKHHEMHLHALPWPSEALRSLGGLDVRMRVTLSFFVSPNPSRRGWRGRYVYPSHGLRFDVQRPLESTHDFRARINKRVDDGGNSAVGESGKWTLGPKLRRRGSLITDVWTGTAAELADRGSVAVFPSTGWWKSQAKDEESVRGARYALLVSIEAPDADVDLWTAVSNQIDIGTSVEVEL